MTRTPSNVRQTVVCSVGLSRSEHDYALRQMEAIFQGETLIEAESVAAAIAKGLECKIIVLVRSAIVSLALELALAEDPICGLESWIRVYLDLLGSYRSDRRKITLLEVDLLHHLGSRSWIDVSNRHGLKVTLVEKLHQFSFRLPGSLHLAVANAFLTLEPRAASLAQDLEASMISDRSCTPWLELITEFLRAWKKLTGHLETLPFMSPVGGDDLALTNASSSPSLNSVRILEHILYLEENLRNCQAEIASIKQKNSDLQSNVESMTHEIHALQENERVIQDAAKSEIAALTDSLRQKTLEAEINSQSQIASERALADLTNQTHMLRGSLDACRLESTEQRDINVQLTNELSEQRSKLTTLQQEISLQQENMLMHIDLADSLAQSNAEKQEVIAQLRSQLGEHYIILSKNSALQQLISRRKEAELEVRSILGRRLLEDGRRLMELNELRSALDDLTHQRNTVSG